MNYTKEIVEIAIILACVCLIVASGL